MTVPTFELSRLDSYDDASLLEELKRVAALVTSPVITIEEFNRHSRASASTILNRFGSWARALELSDLSDRYSGSPDGKRHLSRAFTEDEMLLEMRRVAEELSLTTMTMAQFDLHGAMWAETIRRRFGSWQRAIEKAGLTISNRGKRHSEEDYFENLLRAWTHYGRQPKYGEMSAAPSLIGAKAYEAKWGGWRKALKAFLERVNADLADRPATQNMQPPEMTSPMERIRKVNNRRASEKVPSRNISLGLRYDVLRRDRFRCVICGVSPASKLGCELHVDHVHPFALGELPQLKIFALYAASATLARARRSSERYVGNLLLSQQLFREMPIRYGLRFTFRRISTFT